MAGLLCKCKSAVCDSCDNCRRCNCECQDAVQSDVPSSSKRRRNEVPLGQHRQVCENVNTGTDFSKNPRGMYTALGMDPNSPIIRHLPAKAKRSCVTTWMDNSQQGKSMKTSVFQVYKEMFTFISNILCGEAAEISLAAAVEEFREKKVTKKSSKSVSHVMIKTMSSAVKKNSRIADNQSFALLFTDTGGSKKNA